ncbi:MAG: prepilin-type N-terminal cleavage/methylation domain-containing protein, partial [Bacillota bacterium]
MARGTEVTFADRPVARGGAYPRFWSALCPPAYRSLRFGPRSCGGARDGWQDGFSLMEMAVVLGVIVVLLAVSVPVLARQNQVQKL